MTTTRFARGGSGPLIKRQAADLPTRLMESWTCEGGHDFGFDPDRGGVAPTRCPVPEGENFSTCRAAIHRVKAAGVLRPERVR